MSARFSAASLSPELKFILTAARPSAHLAADFGDAKELAAEIRDWKQVETLAETHGVRPLCFDFVRHVNSAVIPQTWTESLSRTVQILTRRSLALTAELFHLLDLLERASIPAIPYKGPVLAAQAYGDIARREYGDLDILIHHRDIAAVENLMQREGYRSAVALKDLNSAAIPGQFLFSRPGALPVEFHTEKTLRYYPVPFDLESLERNLVRVIIGDRRVQTFAAEDGLTILSVHGCKHLWSRLLWVADIAWLLDSSPAIDWNAALARAGQFRSARMMLTGAGLAAELLGARTPDEIEKAIRNDEQVQKLIDESRRELFSSGSAAGILQRALFRVRSVEGFGSGLRYLFRLTASPAEEDCKEEQRSAISAAAMRPVRLLRKYGLSRKRE